MASIFRKLTGRKKKHKVPVGSITVSTSADSHASEVDWKGHRRPQHLEHAAQDPGLSSRSFDHSSKPSSHRKSNSSAEFADVPVGRSGSSEEHSTRRRRSLPTGADVAAAVVAAAATPQTPGGKDSKSALALQGSRRRIKEDHEIFAPPEAHLSPKKIKTQEAKAKKARKEKQRQLATQARKDAMKARKEQARTKALAVSTTPSKSSPMAIAVARPLTPEENRQLILNQEAERTAKAAAALDNRGNEFFERGYYDKAMEAYSRALKLKRRTFHSMLEEADELFDETDELEKEDMDPKLLVSMATSINNIGYLRQRAGEATPDETMTAYKKSLRIKRKILGNDSLSVGKTLNNIGSVYYLKKEFKDALPAYEEALQIMESNLGEGHPDVATVMSNMGDVCFAMKERDESLERYRKALIIRWNAFGEKDRRTVRLLEKIARIEIGDKMPTPRGKKTSERYYDWDESELYDLDLRPISHEIAQLKDEVKDDLERFVNLEKKMAVGMVKDKLRIVRGLRELSEGYDPLMIGSFSGRDEDDPILPASSNTLNKHDNADGHDSKAELLNSPSRGVDYAGSLTRSSFTSTSSNFLKKSFASPSQQRRALSTMNADEIKAVSNEITSALKLKKGIDQLRSIDVDEENTETPKIAAPPLAEAAPSPLQERQVVEVGSDRPSLANLAQDPKPPTSAPVAPAPPPILEETEQVKAPSSPVHNVGKPKIIHATWLGEVEG